MAEKTKRPVVLAVDDESANAELVRRVLKSRPDVHAMIALSVREAMATAQLTSVSVLIVDQKMPVMSGVELCRWFKKVGVMPAAIMLTAYPEDPEVVAARDGGLVRCVISKPWKVEDLLMAIDLALQSLRKKA
jgi:CheY-like chemotaxis protein